MSKAYTIGGAAAAAEAAAAAAKAVAATAFKTITAIVSAPFVLPTIVGVTAFAFSPAKHTDPGEIEQNKRADNTVSDDDYDDSYDDYYGEGSTERVGKQKGNAPRDNQKQNEQTDKVAKELGLTKEQSRQLHDYITGQGYSYKEILDIAKDLFVK